MVQFLSIIFFFLDFFNFCWVFQKFPFFVSPCTLLSHAIHSLSTVGNRSIDSSLTSHSRISNRVWRTCTFNNADSIFSHLNKLTPVGENAAIVKANWQCQNICAAKYFIVWRHWVKWTSVTTQKNEEVWRSHWISVYRPANFLQHFTSSFIWYDLSLRMLNVTGNWRKMHSEELHDLYFSLNIIRIIKERNVGWARKWHVRWEERSIKGFGVQNWGKGSNWTAYAYMRRYY